MEPTLRKELEFMDFLKSVLNSNYHAQIDEIKQSLCALQWQMEANKNIAAREREVSVAPRYPRFDLIEFVKELDKKELGQIVVVSTADDDKRFHGSNLFNDIPPIKPFHEKIYPLFKEQDSRAWEINTIDKRISKLRSELSDELSKKKSSRNAVSISYLQTSLNNLKKWKQSLS